MISANHRPDYCRDFSRNRGSVMISYNITHSLVSLESQLKAAIIKIPSAAHDHDFVQNETQFQNKMSKRYIEVRVETTTIMGDAEISWGE